MIDFDKIEDKVIANKIIVPKEDEDIDYVIINFFLKNNEIVYIGKTEKENLEYIIEKSNKFSCTHYFTEMVSESEADNILAELILNIQPSLNQRVPNNTKYIAHTKAKELYHIGKNEFKKHWKENGQLKFGSIQFLEQKVFDDIFAIPEPYHKDMPKIGIFINSADDIKNTPLYIYQHYYDRDIPVKDDYENLQIRLKNSYVVTNILNSNTFEAYSKHKNITKKFIANSDEWGLIPDEYDQYTVKDNYLKILDS